MNYFEDLVKRNAFAHSCPLRDPGLFEAHDPCGLAYVQTTRDQGNPHTLLYVYVQIYAYASHGYTSGDWKGVEDGRRRESHLFEYDLRRNEGCIRRNIQNQPSITRVAKTRISSSWITYPIDDWFGGIERICSD